MSEFFISKKITPVHSELSVLYAKQSESKLLLPVRIMRATGLLGKLVASSQLELAVLEMFPVDRDPLEEIEAVSAQDAVKELISFVQSHQLAAPFEYKEDLPKEYADTFKVMAEESGHPTLQYIVGELHERAVEPKLYTGHYL